MKCSLIFILFFLIFLPSNNTGYPLENYFRRITNWAHEKLWGLESAFISNPASIELKNQLLANYYKEYLLAETNKKAKEIKLKISSTTFLSINKRLMERYNKQIDFLNDKVTAFDFNDNVVELNILEYFEGLIFLNN
uniref:Uncharacterized protein n=1 Tax=Meloidogyne enterolobii TaxID=390850 RepID=A0A6V7X2T6_MELEN|nr:unnamed protein product [Meloidogyne enterolobii]